MTGDQANSQIAFALTKEYRSYVCSIEDLDDKDSQYDKEISDPKSFFRDYCQPKNVVQNESNRKLFLGEKFEFEGDGIDEYSELRNEWADYFMQRQNQRFVASESALETIS